jgi:ATP-dependent DNA ligase
MVRTGFTKSSTHDGCRLIVQRDGMRVRLFTRNGHEDQCPAK